MKVLIIGSVYPRYHEDAEVPWLRASVAHLRKAGVDVQLLVPAYKGLKSHEIDGVKVNRFRYATANMEHLTGEEGAPSKIANNPLLQLLAIPYIIFGFFKCLSICRQWKPDILHVHWPFPHAFIALGAAKFFRIPMVLNFHGAELLLMRKKKWVRPFLKFAISQAKAVFANSSFTAGKIKALRNVDVEWSPYGTTLGKADNLVSAHSITDKFKILFVGRHIERKGICYLIEAAKYLPADQFEIRIVGTGDLTEKLKAQAAEISNGIFSPSCHPNREAEANLPFPCHPEQSTENAKSKDLDILPASIIFTGKLSSAELENEYRNANAFVLPAIVDSKGDTEGLGVVLIEAMELGLPIVASNVGGIPDVVVDGETGILVPEKNPQAIADAFKRLAADPALVETLLMGARKRIAECFSWDKIVERQIKVYERVMTRH